MKKTILAAALLGLAVAGVAHASDNKVMMPIATAMESNDAPTKLAGVKFFFGDQATPRILQKFGTDTTSQKTNAFAKSDEKVCNWVFLSGMLSLHKRALELGANAVIVVSNYNNVPYSSATDFECHVGGIMGGAAFKGEFVKIAE